MTAVAPLALTEPDVRHSAESSCWYTPLSIVEPARAVLGGRIGFDPATDEAANAVINARRVAFERDNGLAQRWGDTVFLNPPTPPKAWWVKLMRHVNAGDVPRAVYVAYSIEQLQQSQHWAAESGLPSMLDFAVCIPRSRVTFMRTAADAIVAWHKAAVKLRARGKEPTRRQLTDLAALEAMAPRDLVPGEQPAHASAVVGVNIPRGEFAAAFSSLGRCL